MAAALVSVAAAPTARAGLSLDEALQRHASLLADTPFVPVVREGFVLAMARDVAVPPLLLGRPVLGDTGAQFLLRGAANPQGLEWQLGGLVLEDHARRFRLDGSAVSVPFGPGRAYLSDERRHWGPAWTHSLILDASAPAVPAIGWRKTDASAFEHPWLRWLGPWQADVFFGQLDNTLGPRHAKLIGMRAQIEPLRDLEIGFSRVLQWGGSGRPESPGSLLRGLLGIDNIAGSDRSEEPGNQLGGFDARYTLRPGPGTTLSAYGQAIGEDEANKLPSKYIASLGVDAGWRLDGGGTLRTFAEFANTIAGGSFGRGLLGTAYRHPLYPAGYQQQGRPLGHPAAADLHLGSLGAYVGHGPASAALLLHRGRIEGATAMFPVTGGLKGIDAELSWALANDFEMGGSLSRWQQPDGRRTGVQVWWRGRLR